MPKLPKQTVSFTPIGAGIPPTTAERRRLELAAADYLAYHHLTPPVSLSKLKQHAMALLSQEGFIADYLPYTIVILNNTLWQPGIRKIPYTKRLLLIPQCLKSSRYCTAECDQFGLLCKHCGHCVIDNLSRRAEQLGYTVLIAEGSPVVMALIQSGQIEAVIGVSCLPVLEKVFPYMEAGAVPGIALPLLYDGCKDTAFDIDRLKEILEDYSPFGQTIHFDQLRRKVTDWFSRDSLRTFLKDPDDATVSIAIDWLTRAGKHYRPLLTAAMYAACSGTIEELIPKTVHQAAIAVECFHKASLIHDDIEDGDIERYGQKTLHAQFGIPIALNTGDLLIGEGYRLLVEIDIEPSRKNALLAIAANGHRALCIGQGNELTRMNCQATPSVNDLLHIFTGKTAPAFSVALKIGAILAGADDALLIILEQYSEALGIAYQIRDDLLDWQNIHPDKLSIVTAAGSEQAARKLLHEYRQRAVDCIDSVQSSQVKTLLRRVITKIFDDTNRMGCCDEHTRQLD